MNVERKNLKKAPESKSPFSFISRRSPVLCTTGMVASSQSLASQIGLRILEQGGNAADACVAMAAALNVTEPTSTGIGGDCFALYFNAKTKKVEGLNASGRAPKRLTRQKALEDLGDETALHIPAFHVHSVTVPGAAAGWCDTATKWGTMPLAKLLQPAIDLAEKGFPVHSITAELWAAGVPQLMRGPHHAEMLMPDSSPPKIGDIFKNPTLANTFRLLGEHSKDGFYKGPVAQAIIDVLKSLGSVMELEDLAEHVNTFPDPISTNYKGIDVFEIPPNGQGLTALLALNIVEAYHKLHPLHPEHASVEEFGSVSHLHVMIEAMRLAFADTRWYVADPEMVNVPVKELLSKEYALSRAKLINPEKAAIDPSKGSPFNSSDTVYFCAVDAEGNACSFINSNYVGFGSGIIPKGCGFTLQNRGHNFSLQLDHPNVLAPGKRPYHTIIPGMALKDGELYCPFGVMGAFMQPQGHLQVLVNMIDFDMDPQQALDAPRFCIESGEAGGSVCIEDGIAPEVVEELKRRGHDIVLVEGFRRALFGRGQIIRRAQNGVLWGGSDGRADGCAAGY